MSAVLRTLARAPPAEKMPPRPRKGLWGIASGAFGSKWPTLQFFGSDGTWEVVQLRRMTGSLVLVKIRGEIYPVLLDGRRAKTYRYAGVPVAQTFLYSLDDMMPFDPTEWQRIDAARKTNEMPPIGPELASLILAASDYLKDADGVNHVTVSDMAQTMNAKDLAESEIMQFVRAAGVTKINKPIPELLEFCRKRLLVDPSVVSAAIVAFARTERQWAAIANPARGPFKHWTLVLVAVGLIATIGAVVGIGATQGWFDDLGGSGSLEAIFEQARQFDTPEAAELAEKGGAAITEGLGLVPP